MKRRDFLKGSVLTATVTLLGLRPKAPAVDRSLDDLYDGEFTAECWHWRELGCYSLFDGSNGWIAVPDCNEGWEIEADIQSPRYHHIPLEPGGERHVYMYVSTEKGVDIYRDSEFIKTVPYEEENCEGGPVCSWDIKEET